MFMSLVFVAPRSSASMLSMLWLFGMDFNIFFFICSLSDHFSFLISSSHVVFDRILRPISYNNINNKYMHIYIFSM